MHTLRTGTRVLAFAVLAVLGLLTAAVAILQIPAVSTWAGRRLLPLLPLNPGYRIDVGAVGGNWLTGVRLGDVRLLRNERTLAHIEQLEVGYDPTQLLGSERQLRSVQVSGASITARQEDGAWDIIQALGGSEDPTGKASVWAVEELDLSDVQLALHLAPDSLLRVRDLTLRAKDLVLGDQFLAELDTVHASVVLPGSPPVPMQVAASGAVTRDFVRLDSLRIVSARSYIAGRLVVPFSLDDPHQAQKLAVSLRATPLALADASVFFPALSSDGELELEISASSEGKSATATLAGQLGGGTLRLTGKTQLGTAAASYQVSGDMRSFNPAALLQAAPGGSLTGAIELDLQGDSLEVAEGVATLRLSDSRLDQIELEKLDLTARMEEGRANLDLRGDLAAARVAAKGWVRPFDSIPSYRLAGMAWDIPGTEDLARTLAGSEGNPELRLAFRANGKGADLEAAALTGRVELAALRSGGERVELGHASVRLNNGRLRARPDLRVGGGRVEALLVAAITDTIKYEVRGGTIDRVDLGRLTGDTLAGPVSGSFAGNGRGLSPREVVATAGIRLRDLPYRGRRLEDVVARARLKSGRLTLQITGDFQGGGVAVRAAGRPFDAPRTFTADSVVLTEVDLGSLVNRPDLSGPVSLHGSASGRWGEGVHAFRGGATIQASKVGEIDIAGGSLSATFADGLLTYDASVQTTDGAVQLAGEARPLDERPSYRVKRGRVDSLDLGELMGRADLASSLDARFTASAVGKSLDSLRLDFRVELLPSTVNQAQLRTGRAELSVRGGEARGSVLLQGPAVHVAADLSGDLRGEVRRIQTGGTVRLEELERWTGNSGATGRLEGTFSLETLLDSAGLSGVGGTITAFGGVGGIRVRSLHAVLQPDSGSIIVDTLMLRSSVGILDGGGSISLREDRSADTLRLDGRIGDVNELAELAGVDSLTLDSARVHLTLSGPPGERTLRGRGFGHRVLYSATLVEQLRADLTAALDSTGLGAIAGAVRIQGLAKGALTVREAEFAGRYDSLIALNGSATLPHGVRFHLALDGATRGDTASIRLKRLRMNEGGRTWQLAQPAEFAIRPNGLQVNRLVLRTEGRLIGLDGLVALRDTSDLTLRMDSVELGALHRAGLAPVPGLASGQLQLTGPPGMPVLTGHLSLAVHDGDQENLGRLESRLTWTRLGLELTAIAAHRQGGRFTIAGKLPWGFTLAPQDTTALVEIVREPGEVIDLSVDADSFELALLRPFVPRDVARRLRGNLEMDARVQGPPEKPLARGDIRLADLSFEVPATNVLYERGRLAGALAGDVLRIDTLMLYSGTEEELAAHGQVRLRPLANPAFDLAAQLNDFQVSSSAQLRGTATGKVELKGTAEAPVLSGSLRMGPTEFYASGASGMAVADVQLSPKDRLEVARHFGPGVLAGAEDDGFLERFRLDLDLRLPDQVWFRRREAPELNVEVTGRIRLRQEPGGDMRFFGSVEPVPGRSTLDVYGRSFGLTGGEIILQGPVEDTRIDVTAEFQVPTQGAPEAEGVIINVAAQGRPDSLALEFSSDPEMPQEDMISYIVTGRPSSDNSLVAGSSAGGEGEQLVLSQLSDAVSSAVGQELGFDVFQIRQDGTQGLTLVAGRYLTPQFYVSLQQPLELSGQAEQAPGANLGPGFELQYRINTRVWATMQGGSLPSGVLLRGRYAY